MILTTTDFVPGYDILQSFDLVKGTAVYFASGFLNSGALSQETEMNHALSKAKEHLENEASRHRKAEAVIGIKSSVAVTNIGKDDWVVLTLIGTAVSLRKKANTVSVDDSSDDKKEDSSRIDLEAFMNDKYNLFKQLHEIDQMSSEGYMTDEECIVMKKPLLAKLDELRKEEKDLVHLTVLAEQKKEEELQALKSSGWICPACGEHNPTYRVTCHKCGATEK